MMLRNRFRWLIAVALMVLMLAVLALPSRAPDQDAPGPAATHTVPPPPPVVTAPPTLALREPTSSPTHVPQAAIADVATPAPAGPLPPGVRPLAPEVVAHLRAIHERGITRGNRDKVFSRVGDSLSVSHFFLRAIGEGHAQLGAYAYLQDVIDHYSAINAREGNAFVNPSLATGVGWAAWGALEPANSDANLCRTGETPLVCEYRVTRPSVALIMFGTNDVGYIDPITYRQTLQQILDISLEMGVIPILSTIPNRPGLEDRVQLYNDAVRSLADENAIPLWDYAVAMADLPDQGLHTDGVHPSTPPAGYRASVHFTQPHLQYGYTMRNLTALAMLDQVWRALS